MLYQLKYYGMCMYVTYIQNVVVIKINIIGYLNNF